MSGNIRLSESIPANGKVATGTKKNNKYAQDVQTFENEVETVIDNATFSQTVESEDIDFSNHQHAILTVKTGTVTTTPILTVALKIKDSNGNYITHTTLTAIRNATTLIEEFFFLAAQTIQVVCTFEGSGSFASVTVELAMK
jgi:hypothetical protein